MNVVAIKPNEKTRDLVKYGSVSDLVAHTQQLKTQAIADGNKAVRLYVDGAMTNIIADVATQLHIARGHEVAGEYLNRTKGMVTDTSKSLENLIKVIEPKEVIIDAEVTDDPRLKELETKNAELEAKLNAQYTSSVATKAVLEKDLERAKEVIHKLETDEDLTQALKESAQLQQELKAVTGKANQVGALQSELSAKNEAIANARTLEQNLKRQLALEADKVREAKAEIERKRGEALLTHEDKERTKSLLYVDIVKEVRESYPLQAYLEQNGMTKAEITLAQSQPPRKEYDTEDVEEIATLIYTQRNEVSDRAIIDKIEGLIANAMLTVEQEAVREQYSTLKKQYETVIRTMTQNSLGE